MGGGHICLPLISIGFQLMPFQEPRMTPKIQWRMAWRGKKTINKIWTFQSKNNQYIKKYPAYCQPYVRGTQINWIRVTELNTKNTKKPMIVWYEILRFSMAETPFLGYFRSCWLSKKRSQFSLNTLLNRFLISHI